MKIAGKSVFLTGGAGGLGCAIARCALQNGARVCLADDDKIKGDKLLKDLKQEFGEEKVIFVTCDISSEESFADAFKTALEAFKTVDVMVNNAAILNEKDWTKATAINLKGTMTGTDLARDHMRIDKGGHGGVIINIASVAALDPHFNVPVNSATKSEILTYTSALASAPDVSELGVRYACVCPGAMDTEMGHKNPDAFLSEYLKFIGNDVEKIKPEMVAESVFTIVEDDDSNGAVIRVDAAQGVVRKKLTVVNA